MNGENIKMKLSKGELELYVQIRDNAQKIELAKELLESVTMQHHEVFKKEVIGKLEVLRVNNYTDFCRLGDQLDWRD
jgi:hypothetical protein